MTEYGRSPGSEPWRPDDPLYGDQGWDGGQAAQGQGPYDAPHAQDPYAQQQQYQTQYQQQGYDQQAHDRQGYDQQQYEPQQYGAGPQDPYGSVPQDPYGHQAPQQQYPQQPQYDSQGWDTGHEQQAAPYAPPYEPYAYQPEPLYGAPQDGYGTPEAYPPPQPPGRRTAPEPQVEPEWDPDAPHEETHPFFTGTDDPRRPGRDEDDDEPGDEPRATRGGERRGKGKKKSRNGCACLVVALVLVGGVGGVGYYGYHFWQDQFGAPVDYTGMGTGPQVEVEIPKGALGYDIANLLKKQGVVKSVDAFVSAQNANPKGKSIQAGVYLLNKQMSAANAVKMMLDPKSQNALVIPEGTRNAKIYEMIDERIGLDAGTTEKVAREDAKDLGLPDWALGHKNLKDPLEGFLFPAAYPVAKGSKPEAALKRMVARANEEYADLDLEGTAKKYGLDGPWQVLTVASLVQAEGLTHDDFRKMAEVVYNRLKPDNTITNRKLEFDSAFNYLMKQSEIKITLAEIRTNPDLYNTYYHTGLPPGPISNPGDEAVNATLNPTADGWMFFISLDGKKTDFTKTVEEHEELNNKFKEMHDLQ